ncbi:MAG TPA: hypothetical protein DEA22_01270 [Blastocatellia bacterium]|nr:hypothetical protein [Blastocatellia bacterium]
MSYEHYRILSLDGGGIRGLITAIWLNYLETELQTKFPGKKLRDFFDLIAGTSTGSILGCAVASGMETKKIIDLYKVKAGTIFPRYAAKWLYDARLLRQVIAGNPIYDGKGLEKELKAAFGVNEKFSFPVKTMVVSYDTFNRQPLIFKSWREDYHGLPIWEVCRASSAAPVYLPAHVLTVREADIPLIDGGVVANNPTVCAISEGIKLQASEPPNERVTIDNFVVASFGTGSSTSPITIKQAVGWGPAKWMFNLIDVLFDASLDAVDYAASQLIAQDNYFRFQVNIEKQYADLDNPDKDNINGLAAVAEGYLNSTVKEQVADLISKL